MLVVTDSGLHLSVPESEKAMPSVDFAERHGLFLVV